MLHLKLTKGLSYTGHGITASRQVPDVFSSDETVVAALLDTGYFALIGGSNTPAKAPDTGTIEAIDTMGSTKLRAYAKEHGLDLTWEKGTEADIIRSDIKAALDAREAEEDPSEQFATGGEAEEQGGV